MSSDEDELDQVCAQISELLDRNRLTHARRLLDQALPRFPDAPMLIYLAAHTDWRDGRNEDAERHVRRLLELDPHNYMGRVILADLHEQREELAQSEQLYLSLIADFPESADLYGYYAMLMLRTMHVDKAAALAAEALRLDPDNPTGLQVTTLTSIVKGDQQRRDASLTDMIQRYPELQATSGLLVQVLVRDGRYAEAQRVAQQMLGANPQNSDLVDMVIETRRLSHWSMWPMRPFVRYGWGASVALWFVAVIAIRTLPYPADGIFGFAFILFVIYSWVWPFILKRLIKR